MADCKIKVQKTSFIRGVNYLILGQRWSLEDVRPSYAEPALMAQNLPGLHFVLLSLVPFCPLLPLCCSCVSQDLECQHLRWRLITAYFYLPFFKAS